MNGQAPSIPAPHNSQVLRQFFVEVIDQQTQAKKKHKAQGVRVSHHDGFVYIIDHLGATVLAFPQHNVVSFGYVS